MADATISAAGLRIAKLLVGHPPQTVSDLLDAAGVTRTAVTEQLNEAAVKKNLGYSLLDIATFLGEPDPEEIVRNASEASAVDAQALGRSLMNGNIDYGS